jgi:hypothetical protein
VAQRIKVALDLLDSLPQYQKDLLRNRTFVQSALTLTCRMGDSLEGQPSAVVTLGSVFQQFLSELNRQIELGNKATANEYLEFQRTVNANIKQGARIRQLILARKLLSTFPQMADSLDAVALAEIASTSAMKSLAANVANAIALLNTQYAAKNGSDLFKPTNRTVQAQNSLGVPVKDFQGYKTFIDNLYFLFHEGPADRLQGQSLPTFDDVNDLRTDLQHDVDHGKANKVTAKRKKIAASFQKYSGVPSPESLDPEKFAIVQANLLSGLLNDLNSTTV